MNYPAAIIEKSKRTEQLVKRVEAGESLDNVSHELNLSISPGRFAKLVKRYKRGGQTHQSLIDGRQGHPQKSHAGIREFLYNRKRKKPQKTAPQLAAEIEKKFSVKFSDRHINYLLRRVGLSGPRGRPRSGVPDEASKTEASKTETTLPVDEVVSNVGLFFPPSSDE